MERKKEAMEGENKKENTWFHYMKAPIAGGISGFMTRAMTQPLDCIKVRHQLQLEPIKKHSGAKYTSTSQTLMLIFKEEGIKGLWKGHVPGQILSVTYGFGQFAAYDQFNRHSRAIKFFEDHSDIRHTLSGGLGGAIGMLFSTPFDVCRTRFIAQDKNKGYKTMIQAFSSILTNEGFRGLFRGLTPSIIAIAPMAAIQFGTYNYLLENWIRQKKRETASRYTILLAGIFSGIIAKSCVYPCDLTKKRLQIQHFQGNRKTFGQNITCTGMFDCLRQTMAREGFVGLYKGLTPSLIKSGSMSGLYFFFYEEILTEFNKM